MSLDHVASLSTVVTVGLDHPLRGHRELARKKGGADLKPTG
jgi:hypothetical protein